jgi:hypothetical protein
MCDSQDLALHTVMSDGVAAVKQPLGWGAKGRRKLVQTPAYVTYSALLGVCYADGLRYSQTHEVESERTIQRHDKASESLL